jgi:signal transduction histidine kinase
MRRSFPFSPIDSFITVTAKHQADCVQIDVQDEGPGIPVEAHAYVFEAFRQVENSSKIRKGAGLGLAICKGLIESHQGRIWIETGLESGTIISFTLPKEA